MKFDKLLFIEFHNIFFFIHNKMKLTFLFYPTSMLLKKKIFYYDNKHSLTALCAMGFNIIMDKYLEVRLFCLDYIMDFLQHCLSALLKFYLYELFF